MFQQRHQTLGLCKMPKHKKINCLTCNICCISNTSAQSQRGVDWVSYLWPVLSGSISKVVFLVAGLVTNIFSSPANIQRDTHLYKHQQRKRKKIKNWFKLYTSEVFILYHI